MATFELSDNALALRGEVGDETMMGDGEDPKDTLSPLASGHEQYCCTE